MLRAGRRGRLVCRPRKAVAVVTGSAAARPGARRCMQMQAPRAPYVRRPARGRMAWPRRRRPRMRRQTTGQGSRHIVCVVARREVRRLRREAGRQVCDRFSNRVPLEFLSSQTVCAAARCCCCCCAARERQSNHLYTVVCLSLKITIFSSHFFLRGV
jgi:hypothetical protein